VAGGPAHIRVNERNAKLIYEIVILAPEVGTKLVFWSPVNIDYDGPLAGKSLRRAIEKPRDHLPIKTPPFDEIRFLERIRPDRAEGCGPPIQFAILDVDRKNIRGKPGC